MAWLNGWAKRIKLTIDQNDIDDALANFPILVYVSASSGHSSKDISCVFDELENDANRKKIAVTTSDGETQCYVEIEKWDDANEKAWLWIKVPSIANDADTDLYLYYDKDHADNTDYVGDPSDAVVYNVWDSNFKLVTHMRDDPDNEHVRDSTINANDGTKKGAGEPLVTTLGKIDGAQIFDGVDDIVTILDSASLDVTEVTIQVWVKRTDAQVNYWRPVEKNRVYQIRGYSATNKPYFQIYVVGNLAGTLAWSDALPLNEYTLLMATYNKVTDIMKVYTNGVFDTSVVHPTGGDIQNRADDLVLGNRPALDRGFKGAIDEVRISSVVRTDAWIKASYESERDHLLDFGSEEPPRPVTDGRIIGKGIIRKS